MQISKNILIAPLNWGLGHATRCIPIIDKLLEMQANPIIASDGKALEYLKKEYPELTFITLPSYNIKYAGEGESLKWKMICSMPKIAKAVFLEQWNLKKIIKKYQIDGIISDNRLGLYNSQIPCVFMTHQVQVLTGNTTAISSWLHRYFINKFNQCWIPDEQGALNLAGKMSQEIKGLKNPTFVGWLSQFKKNTSFQKKYDVLIILSGPEPQRSILEKKILSQINERSENILLVGGNVEKKQRVLKKGNFTYYNYLTREGLQKALDRSDMIIARSGYTTVMDMAKLGKRAYFVPTPGQFEQEYLAQLLKDKGIANYIEQESFELSDILHNSSNYTGFHKYASNSVITSIFSMERLLESTFSNVNENSEPIPDSLST